MRGLWQGSDRRSVVANRDPLPLIHRGTESDTEVERIDQVLLVGQVVRDESQAPAASHTIELDPGVDQSEMYGEPLQGYWWNRSKEWARSRKTFD